MKTLALLKNFPAMVFTAAGEEAPILRRSLLCGVLTAILRGLAFLTFFPIFQALSTGKSPWLWLGVLALLTILSSISEWFSRDYDYTGAAGRAGDALRRKIGQHLRQIPLEVLYQQRSGKLNATVAGDIDDVINYTMTISLLVMQAVLIPLVVGLGVLAVNIWLGLSVIFLFPLIIPFYLWARPKMAGDKKALAEANSELSAETVEYTQGLPVLKSACAVGEKFQRFTAAVEEIENVQKKNLAHLALPNIIVASAIEIGLLLIVFMGVFLATKGIISAFYVAALLVATVRFGEPLSVFINMMNVVEMVQVGYFRLQKVLAIEPLPQLAPAATPERFDLDFAAVSFSYAGQQTPALSEIDLHIPAQSLTALVGASGCGKTTLARLLMRYADPQQGTVKIGGVDVRQIDPETLHQLIAVVFQDVYLFDESILANIQMGRAEASEDEIIAAAKAAQCHDFISQLPQGYQTRVGDIGNNLSGGEKQRISIARALLKNAPIVILDEPTAALDTYSELAVQEAINALVKNKTVIVIAHRLSTIVAAQQIVVLDEGKIIERGTHQELLKLEGRYSKLWQLQQQKAYS